MSSLFRATMSATLALAMISVGSLSAAEEEEGDMGATSWSSTNNERCVRTTHQCVKWSADNTPTNEISYECGGLYFFHTEAKVLSTCES